MPLRGTIAIGRLDQRLRCCSSSNANSTVCRCFVSSVERNVFAALTIREVAVSAIADVSGKQINANMRSFMRVINRTRYSIAYVLSDFLALRTVNVGIHLGTSSQ